MKTTLSVLSLATMLTLLSSQANATRVIGNVYCDANSNNQIDVQLDTILPDVNIVADCLGASDQDELPLPECHYPNVPLTDYTDEFGYYRVDLVEHTNLSYSVSLDDASLPGDAQIVLPGNLPAIFSLPMSVNDEFIDPQYIVPYRDGYTYTRPYIAKIDWLISSSVCQEEDPEPHITLKKEVSLNGGEYLDANTTETAAYGPVGSNATYRISVTNDGQEPLYNVVINDAVLGISDFAIPINPFNPGDTVVVAANIGDGFDYIVNELNAPNVCDKHGEYLNTASVTAEGVSSGGQVSADDIAYVVCDEPQVELRKQVSIDGVNYFDADLPSDADVPVGLVGQTDGYYRLIVKNIGSEALTDVYLTDPKLGIDTFINDLMVGETKIIDSGESGFSKLFTPGLCNEGVGTKLNIATVNATGQSTEVAVTDSDPAHVKCISGPAIKILKQVRFGESGQFYDADTLDTAPIAYVDDTLPNRSAEYRFVVENVGDERLSNVTITDNKLNIDKVLIGDLAVGESVVIKSDTLGFQSLYVEGQCNSVGSIKNVVRVRADGDMSGSSVTDNDAAFVKCDQIIECDIEIDKTCSVVKNDTSDKLCTDSISATTLRYMGPNINNATVSFEGKDSGLVSYNNIDLEGGVTVLTKPNQNGFTIDAGLGNKLGSATTITINGKAEIIHTSCSAIYVAGEPAPLDGKTPYPNNSEKGDPSPNWHVVDFRQRDDQVVSEPNTDQEGEDSCTVPYEGADVTYRYQIKNIGNTEIRVTSVLDDSLGELINGNAIKLEKGEVHTIATDPIFVNQSITSSVSVESFVVGNRHIICSAQDQVIIDKDPAPELSCEDGKPVKLGFTYVGGSCSDSDHQQAGKASCSGDSTNVNPARVVVEGKKGELYLSEIVEIGEAVLLDASVAGKGKLDSETHIYIKDGDGVVQHINMHTSCSAPLAVGDQHGGILISSFVPGDDGKKGKKGKKHKDKKKGHKGKKGKKKGDKGKKHKDKKKNDKGKKHKAKKHH